MGIFDSLTSLVGNVATVVLKPVEVVVDLADAAVKPVADVAKDLADDIKSIKD
jgi:hypothetical protein